MAFQRNTITKMVKIETVEDSVFDIYQYVGDKLILGNGVIIGDLFVTAGHIANNLGEVMPCIKLGNSNVEFDSKIFSLSFANEDLKDPDFSLKHYDVAVYKLKNVNSDLALSEHKPLIGSKVKSCRYTEVRVESVSAISNSSR